MKTILKNIWLPVAMVIVLFAGVCVVNPIPHQSPTIEIPDSVEVFHIPDAHRSGFILTADEPVIETPKVTQSPLMAILYNILAALAVAIGAALTALVTAVLTLLAKKFNLQINQHEQELITGAMDTAVHKGEAWAKAHAEAPSSNDKLNYALQTARSLLGTDMAKKYTNEQLAHYAEESVYKAFNQSTPSVPLTPMVATTETPASALPIDAIVALIQAEISKTKTVTPKV